MASTGTQQQRLPASRLLCALCLFLAVCTQSSSCRPLPLADHPSSSNVILLPAPAEATTMAVAAPSSSVPSREDAEDRRRHRLAAAGSHQWLLNKKPRGKAPPSAPSKRTN